jgi:DNA-binding transcriptional LysR family regulator
MELKRVKRRVKLRDLDTLMAVVEAGGMRKAAERLNMSQPAVSKSMQDLEAVLGVDLLERRQRGVVVTPYGDALVHRARAVFAELQGALQEIEHLADPQGGEVHLGCMETLNAGLVGAAVARVLRRYARMRVLVQSGESPDLISHFLPARICEFVVARPSSLPLPAELQSEALFTDSVSVVVGRTHPHANRRRIALDELADENWILSTNEVLAGSPVSQAFEAVGRQPPRARVVTGSLNIRHNLLATGRFVTVMPSSLLHFARPNPSIRVLPIEMPSWRAPTMILSMKERRLGPASQAVLEAIRDMAATLPP